MQNLYRADQVREIDKLASEELRVSGYTLMRSAGKALFEVIGKQWPNARRICIYCGGGNNAGDGYIVARLALMAGFKATAVSVVPGERLRGNAASAFSDFRKMGGSIIPFSPSASSQFGQVDLIVDALLGTGISREVSGDFKLAIEQMNAFERPVLAVDLPSGVNANTGYPFGAAVRADITLSFIARKQGLFTGAAAEYCGQLEFNDLSVPAEVVRQVSAKGCVLESSDLQTIQQRRYRDAHKGKFGHLVVIGGDHGMGGAALMAAEAALRCGAGLVSVATRKDNALAMMARRPELMCIAIEDEESLQRLIEKANVLVVGPGLGQGSWGKQMLASAIRSDKPLLLDADALNLLPQMEIERDNWIITPHPGEAARLLGTSSWKIQEDRITAAQTMSQGFNAHCVLKGAGTVIANPDANFYICPYGNPGMATAGMGDILSGIIAAMIAQGVSVQNASIYGVLVHALAGDKAAELGEKGMIATDLFKHFQAVLNAH